MRAFAFTSYGRNAKGTMCDIPEPRIDSDEVLVEMHAASVNPIDFKVRNGDLRFLISRNFPLVLGSDGAGVVKDIGKDVTRFKPGDQVYFRIPKNQDGTFAEFTRIPEFALAMAPTKISLVDSAALPLVSLTSIQALFELADLQPGQRVFIPAGSGGIGSHAIQIAKRKGLFVATSTSSRNIQWVASLGADQVLDYTKIDPATHLKNFDAVYDTLGGREQTRMFQVLKPGGILVSIVGPPTSQTARELGLGRFKSFVLALVARSAQQAAKQAGVRYEFLFMRPDGKQLADLASWVDSGFVRPIIDRRYSLEETGQALAYVSEGRAQGKVLIQIRG
ncbi:MAG: NADP-dependent oxidoreductase [Pseudomonadota bacterium]